MQTVLDLQTTTSDGRGAILSPCGRYRYRLWRRWGTALDCVFVMLNPSTADAETDDPTIRRCLGYARAWGYGGLEVVNLFAFRATDPGALRQVHDPEGPDNNRHLLAATQEAGVVVCAWGSQGSYRGRGQAVARLLRDAGVELTALRVLGDGSPGHPLYLPAGLKPAPWKSED